MLLAFQYDIWKVTASESNVFFVGARTIDRKTTDRKRKLGQIDRKLNNSSCVLTNQI